MTTRIRWLAFSVVAAVVLLAAGGYGVWAFLDYQERQSAAIPVDTVDFDSVSDGPRILFRNTTLSEGYGMVAAVPLDDPRGARAISGTACDRVHAGERDIMCLRTVRGIVPAFEAVLYDARWNEVASWPLPGVPSRTRVAADSSLVASTSFVTGMSYATVGFSTQTTISTTDGVDYGNLEDFTTLVDGQQLTAVDRNFWGVTFTPDAGAFYATAASGTHTWLVRGDLETRTMTVLRDGVECPSVSPDGTRIAYKKKVQADGDVQWALAVYDLASGTDTVLPETRSVDDQAEWLDDDTILYGLARADAVGDSDIWSVAADGGSEPAVFIEHAWSPAVVRG